MWSVRGNEFSKDGMATVISTLELMQRLLNIPPNASAGERIKGFILPVRVPVMLICPASVNFFSSRDSVIKRVVHL